MSAERLVFDTNVIVSALLFPNSKPGRAFFPALHSSTVLVSEPLMSEVRDVLIRPKFDCYITADDRASLINLLIDEITLVSITVTLSACRDPKDNHVLELAVSGAATTIITGDRDLLALNPFQGIHVITPDDYLTAYLAP